MRKIIVQSFITLDGVIQSPGRPDEDPSGGFEWGGWVAPYGDVDGARVMEKLMQPADLLLGRKTFEIFASYWPQHAQQWPGINEVTKYVLSGSLKASGWQNSVFLNSLEALENLKNSQGSDLKVWGSSKLVQQLLNRDLVDELWLLVHPLTLGKGKKLFDGGSIPAAFALAESAITQSGVIIANYTRAGAVKTGTVGA